LRTWPFIIPIRPSAKSFAISSPTRCGRARGGESW
jgi:hypothetical protein